MSETDADILERMGTDALKWAEEWHRVAKMVYERDGIRAILGTVDESPDLGWMIGWFANALQAGRYQGRRETCLHTDVFHLADDLTSCRTCGMLNPTPDRTHDGIRRDKALDPHNPGGGRTW